MMLEMVYVGELIGELLELLMNLQLFRYESTTGLPVY